MSSPELLGGGLHPCGERRERDVDFAFAHDQRRLQTNHALLIERPRRGDAAFEHLGNDPAAVALVRQLDADEQPESAHFADDVRVFERDRAASVEELLAPRTRIRHEIVFDQNLHCRKCGRARNLTSAEGRGVNQRRFCIGAIPRIGARNVRANRNDTAGESFG